jgi:hypothetical protein
MPLAAPETNATRPLRSNMGCVIEQALLMRGMRDHRPYDSAIAAAGQARGAPHPGPLPEYVERGEEALASALSSSTGRGRDAPALLSSRT